MTIGGCGGLAWRGEGEGWQLEGAKQVVSFHAAPVTVPGADDGPDTIAYAAGPMPPATAQPPLRANVPASVLESESRRMLAAAEWELEWERE